MKQYRTQVMFTVLAMLAGSITYAQEIPDLTADEIEAILNEDSGTSVFLAVTINGEDTNLIAEFVVNPSQNTLSATRQELTEIGIKPPIGTAQNVALDDIVGLTYDFDEQQQTLTVSASFDALLPKVSSAARLPEFQEPQKEFGAVLNYGLAADFNSSGSISELELSSLSSSLDGWIFSPYGTLGSTAFYRYDATTKSDDFIRQESYYEVNNTAKALTFTVGDFLSSSLSWSRPIRMGGIQIRRDFDLRSDIVTTQRLSFSGAAAVPSTVDVFIENNRLYTGTVGTGPFRIEDLPLNTGAGDAVVVIRDQNGDEQAQEVSFFAAQNLLKKGVADYSVELGWAREDFGRFSNEYGSDPIASASLRYGLSEKVTIEAHAELKSDLRLFGLGVAAVPFNLAEVSLAVGQSDYQGVSGAFVQGGLRTMIYDAELNVSMLRSQSGFADLALATGVDYLGQDAISNAGSLLEFPTELDVVSLSIPVTKDRRKMGLSLVRSVRKNSEDFIATGAFSTLIPGTATTFGMSATHSFTTGESSAALTLSVPLGNRRSAYAGFGRARNGKYSASAALSRPIGEAVGDYGYHVQLENNEGAEIGSVQGNYRGKFGKLDAEVIRSDRHASLRARFDGAIAAVGGSAAFGNQINDSFAIVDAGVPNIPIYNQNRPVTRTNEKGRALVYGLSSYRKNRISVNLAEIPEDYTLNATAMDVTPARRSGNLVDFLGSSEPSAVVILRDANGVIVPIGSVAYLNGRKEPFYVGYDGITWLEGVQSSNTLRVKTPTGSCSARFSVSQTGEFQNVIDPVECK